MSCVSEPALGEVYAVRINVIVETLAKGVVYNLGDIFLVGAYEFSKSVEGKIAVAECRSILHNVLYSLCQLQPLPLAKIARQVFWRS